MAKSRKRQHEETTAERELREQQERVVQASEAVKQHELEETQADQRAPEEVEEEDLKKEKPIAFVNQTHNAVFPVDAKHNKETLKPGQRCPVGAVVMLKPTIARRHQNAGVGLVLERNDAA